MHKPTCTSMSRSEYHTTFYRNAWNVTCTNTSRSEYQVLSFTPCSMCKCVAKRVSKPHSLHVASPFKANKWPQSNQVLRAVQHSQVCREAYIKSSSARSATCTSMSRSAYQIMFYNGAARTKLSRSAYQITCCIQCYVHKYVARRISNNGLDLVLHAQVYREAQIKPRAACNSTCTSMSRSAC